ncbi:MAG: hypothetical protein GY859_29810, partial [Desulfobacterales bacterium]|nr:hypothetical protein [Desulfobacterales bacterium]
DQALARAVTGVDPPRSAAVLPFVNDTAKEGLGELFRVSFYSHFSARPFEDVELHLVDRRLGDLGLGSGDMDEADPVRLGRLLGCDAVIMGAATEFNRVFVGVYSQLSVGGSITIKDARDGRLLWTDQWVTRFHEGGIPWKIWDIPLISLRSGYNLREAIKIRAVDDLSRNLVSRLPTPSYIIEAGSGGVKYEYELQVGAFIEEERAVRFLKKLRQEGFPAFIRSNRDHQELWRRVLLGPYEDREEAMRILERIQRDFEKKAFILRVAASTHAPPPE